MRRREVIALIGGVAGWPRAGRAQQHSWGKIGYLSGRSLEPELPILTPFRNGLAEAGHVEGRNASIEFRFAQGHDHLLPMLAKELVDDQVRVLVGTDRPSAVALKKATTTIPIVFASGVNPIDAGLVGSINRPDGNATGVNLFTSELGPKRLEVLRELIPNATVIAFLVNPHDASTAFQLQHIQIAAETVGQRLRIIHVTTEAEIDPAFETAARESQRRDV
jgi:putative ABC transport system substrate-binding protein